jgi:hypothetical protein
MMVIYSHDQVTQFIILRVMNIDICLFRGYIDTDQIKCLRRFPSEYLPCEEESKTS